MRVALVLMAVRDGAAGGTSSARWRRERRQRSWWRHEQLSVAGALTLTHHHSAGPEVVTRSEEQQEEVEHVTNDGLRAQNTPPPGTRPEQLRAAPGPQLAAVTVSYVAAGAPSLVVAPVAAHDGLDDATVQFLFAQTLLAKQQEDEEARQAEELTKWEDKFAKLETRTVEEVDRLRRLGDRSDLTTLLNRVSRWYVTRDEVLKRKEKRKKKKKKKRRLCTRRTRWRCSS